MILLLQPLGQSAGLIKTMKQGWEIKKLGEVCESDLGKTLNQSKDKGELRPYLCAINVLWDKFDFTTLKETRFDESELDRYSVRKGDLLICEGGDIGRAAIWEYDYVIQYQNALHRVRLDKNVNSRFLLLYLRHLKTSGELDAKYGKGVTIKHLVKSSLLSIPIPIPPCEEQERIVEELDCLSGVIERKREQLKQLDALAQSIFYQMFGDPITNEKGWDVKKVKDIFSVKIGPFGSLLHNSDYISGGTPLVNPIHMHNERICPDYDFSVSDNKLKELGNYILHTDDIVLARRGDIGRCAIVGMNEDGYLCGTGSLFIRPITNINSNFIIKQIRCNTMIEHLTSLAKGATMLNINCKIVEELIVILPPLTLQQEFADKIEAIEKQKELIKKSISETENLFNARMDYYFN